MSAGGRICRTGEHLSGEPRERRKPYKHAFGRSRWGVDGTNVGPPPPLIQFPIVEGGFSFKVGAPSVLELAGTGRVLADFMVVSRKVR